MRISDWSSDVCSSDLKGHDYGRDIEVASGVTIRFHPAGHILGAAHVSLDVQGQRLHFSGDLGRQQESLMNPPTPLPACDVLVCESTYGNREQVPIEIGRAACRERVCTYV